MSPLSHPNLIEGDDALAEIVRTAETVAVLGMKDEPGAPAYDIPAVIQSRGLRVIPVNPKLTEALGERAYPNLAAIGSPVDIVDVFRRSEAIGEVADEILALPAAQRPKVVWLQSGIRNDAASIRLAQAGIRVVQDRCLGVYASRHRRG